MQVLPGGPLPGCAHPSTFHLCSAVLRYTWEAPVLTHTALCELLKLFSAKVVECVARQASSVPAIL